MRVTIDVDLTGYSIDDIVDLANTIGCPVKVKSSYKDMVRWMVQEYGRSLLSRVDRFVADRNQDE